MKFKILALVLAIVMVMSCFAGCSPKAPSADAPEPAETTPQAENAPENVEVEEPTPEEPVVITIDDLIVDPVGLQVFLADRQAQFAIDHPEIIVNHIDEIAGDTTNMVEYLSVAFMGTDAPTAKSVSSVGYIRDLYNAGLAADVSHLLKDTDSFYACYDNMQAACTYDDAVVAIPHMVDYPLLGFFNENLIAAGYDPATFTCETWDDYLEVTKAMTTDTVAGGSLYAYEYFLWPANWFMANNAYPAIQNDDGTITLDFTNDAFVDTLKYFQTLWNEGVVQSDINNTDLGVMLNYIFSKQVASFTCYPSWLEGMLVPNGIEASDVTMTPFPMGPNATADTAKANIFVAGYVFNSRATDEEIRAAMTYIDYMYGVEGTKAKYEYMAENSMISFTMSPFPAEEWKSLFLEYGVPESWITSTEWVLSHGEVSDLKSTAFTTYLTPHFANIIRGEVDIMEALTEAQEMAEREWLNDFNAFQ